LSAGPTADSGEDGAMEASSNLARIEADRNRELDALEGLLELEAVGEVVQWPAGVERELITIALRERGLRKRAGIGGVNAPTQVIIEVPAVAVDPPAMGLGAQAPTRQLAVRRVDRSNIGSGHILYIAGDVVFCWACGYWTSGNVRKDGLGGPCSEPKKSNESTLRHLKNATHPRTHQPLPQPRRLR
jgi:hypothetical protein